MSKNKWNGGKISSMFIFENNKYKDQLEFTSIEANDAFYDGIWYLKVHGSCCAIDTVSGTPYQRVNLPNKNKLSNVINLEDGCQPKTLSKNDIITHDYYWEPFKHPDEVTNKSKQYKLLVKIWKLADMFSKSKVTTDLKKNLVLVELCGYKFQKTPGIDNDVVIVEHLKQEFNTLLTDGTTIRTLKNIKKYLSEHAIEGFICSHPKSNKRFKIKSNMFDKDCLHDLFHKYWMKHRNMDIYQKFINDCDIPLFRFRL